MIYYRILYNTGELSMIIQDDRETIYACADLLSKNKEKHPVAIFSVRVKKEQA